MITLPWIPLGLIGILSWSVWLVRRTLSRRGYREVVNDFRTTTSLVVPVYREDADVLERCLRTWLAEGPTEIILVVDDRDDLLLARLRRLDLPTVKVLPWRHTGKRGALGAGVRAATGEIIVFSDSDTSWRPGLLAALQMPFVDPQVGGVGSRQHVHLPAQRHPAPGRLLAAEHPLPRLRAGDVPPRWRRLPVRAYRRLPPLGHHPADAGPGARDLPRSRVRRRRRRPADLAGAGRRATAPCTRPRRRPTRCSPTRGRPSSSSACAGAATPTAPT